MSPTSVLDFFAQRCSSSSRSLTGPGPDAQQLQQLLSIACRVPDHGRLVPWRFLLIEGGARAVLGELLVKRTRELDPQAAAPVIDKEAARFCFAPTIVTVIARLTPGHKIPEREQLLSAGAVTYQLLLAAQAMGFGAQWLTAWAAYDPVICAALGLAEHESVVGFVHIGSMSQAPAQRERPDPQQLLSRWAPPA
jgi:nitroreductase